MTERRYWFPKPYADRVQRLRVLAGFLMVVAFVWWSAPTGTSLSIGIPIAAVGIGIRAWAAGHLEKNMQLATSGPYAYVRNPLYVGTLLAAAGFAFASQRWELAVLFGGVFMLVYLPVIELEEQHLRKLFPEYAGYAHRVPMLVPRPAAIGEKSFRWSVYARNEEYQAALGFLAGAGFLVWKALR